MNADENTSNYDAIGTVCNSVISDPSVHIEALIPLIDTLNTRISEYEEIIMLSLVKVFKNIVPLYKIKTFSNKLKTIKNKINQNANALKQNKKKNGTTDSKEIGEIEFGNEYDKQLLEIYTKFIKKILIYENEISYRCACLLFESLWHFNCADKLAVKLLRGSLIEKCSKNCIEVLFRCTNNIELVDKIVEKMTTLKFNPSLLPILTMIEIGDNKKILDNILRVYFGVLNEKLTKFYKNTLIGLRFYSEKIHQKFLEGTYILLNEILKTKKADIKIEAIRTILHIYETKDMDFKDSINALYDLIKPFKYKLNELACDNINELIKKLLIIKRQPKCRIKAFVHRLLQLCNVGPYFVLRTIVNNLIMSYQIDIKDIEICGDVVYDFDCENVDTIGEKPFFEYCLFKTFKEYQK